VTITERMLMAGFRFPFPLIAWELLVLKRTKLQKRMTIDEFLTIYQAGFRRDSSVEFTVRKKPSIIHLAWRYSNNKEWKEQTFRVSGQWEKPE
jgi:hypothetical protein